MTRYAIVEAPSALGHVPEHLGVERAPEVLLGAGLADGLDARRAGRVEAAGYSAERDPQTKVMNPHAISGYSPLLAGGPGGRVLDSPRRRCLRRDNHAGGG